MKRNLQQLAEAFIARNPDIKETGQITTLGDFNNLPSKVRDKIPSWFKELLLNFPIANAEIGIPNDYGQEELKMLKQEDQPSLVLTFLNVQQIASEALNTFPAYQLIEDGFLCVARDEMTTQEGVFIDVTMDDPKLHLVFHDMGESNTDLIRSSEVLLPNFSDVFILGRIEK
jgi:hypothetical protein